VDINGHPPIPLAQKLVFHLGRFLAVFWVPNFWGHFEALNEVFWGFGAEVIASITNFGHSKIVLLNYTFPMGYRASKTKIVCKSYDRGKLMY
jgi:hypothetical protein